MNSYTKVVHGGRGPYGVDWITEYENGTYLHAAEPRHATIAITETSIQRMKVRYFEYSLKFAILLCLLFLVMKNLLHTHPGS